MHDVHLWDNVFCGPFGDSAVVLSKKDLEVLLRTTMFLYAQSALSAAAAAAQMMVRSEEGRDGDITGSQCR